MWIFGSFLLSVIFCIFFSFLLFSFWTSRGHTGVVPSSPRVLPSIFIAHNVQQSHCWSIFHRVLLTHALALSASQFVHKKKSQRVYYTSMPSAGLELTKLTDHQVYIPGSRTEDNNNLIRHRGDRLIKTSEPPYTIYLHKRQHPSTGHPIAFELGFGFGFGSGGTSVHQNRTVWVYVLYLYPHVGVRNSARIYPPINFYSSTRGFRRHRCLCRRSHRAAVQLSLEDRSYDRFLKRQNNFPVNFAKDEQRTPDGSCRHH